MQTARADSLTWDVTPDVGRFQEAINFFSKRVVMTADEAFALDDDSRRRAFWVGGGLQLTQVQGVFDEISKALESGEDYASFRKRLLSNVAIAPGHLDTVFRNATQRSYNAGRWEQMQAAKELRPYVMFDAVLDSRSSDICGTKIDGKIVSIDDPFLKTNSPQRHHRCRTGLRSLRAKDAERRGIAKPEELAGAPPAAKGFGLIPTDAPVWKPDPKKHDAKLVDELAAKETKPRKARKPKKPPKEHDPAHWEAEYRKPSELAKNGYGDAAPSLAWGRAMLERGLDRPVGELITELERLAKAHPDRAARDQLLSDIKTLGHYPANKPLRQTTGARFYRAHVALAEHTRAIRAGAFDVPLPNNPAGRGAKFFYEHLLDASVQRPTRARVVMFADLPEEEWRPWFDGPRAHFNPKTKKVVLTNEDAFRTAVHEFAHAIEDADMRAVARSKAFLDARTVDEPLRSKPGYQSWEKFREDRFWVGYVGHGNGAERVAVQNGTEVTSMGYEWLVTPQTWQRFEGADRDHFLFSLGQLAGR